MLIRQEHVIMMIIIGLLLAFVGGGVQGAFVYPLKFMNNWKWENGWFIFTLVCCLIAPVILAFVTTSSLFDVYKSIDVSVLLLVFIFGLGWGIGVVLFGLGAKMLGMALGIAIITGLNACFGTLFPILFLPTGAFGVKAGLILGSGLVVLILGVIIASMAGQQRDREQSNKITAAGETKTPFKIGLLVCIVAAIFCPSTNFAVFFGQPIAKIALENGVSVIHVGWAQLLPFYLGGFLVNAGYCLYLFRKNRSFANYKQSGFTSNSFKGIIMAFLFLAGMILYTMSSAKYIPEIGPIVGWPLFMAATIISSNILGVVSGEWKGVSKRAFIRLYTGIGLLIVAIVLSSMSNMYLPVR